MNSHGHDHLIEALTTSKLYKDYERAFNDATGLPVALRPVGSWQLPHHRKRNENPFCAMMAGKSHACAVCLQVQKHLADSATHEPCTVNCPHGLCETAVPVRLGDRLVGFLQTGQVFRKVPTAVQFERTAAQVDSWGLNLDREKMKAAYFDSRVLTPQQYAAMVKMLAVFAEHLSMVSNQIVMHQQNTEPPMITRAKEFIRDHQTEHLSLGQAAAAVHTSSFYLCKMFKKAMGINFTDYVSRLRVEKAKNLLLNPNLRISEIAYEVGFQSLTHFNRVFKKITGQSPTEYRAHLPARA